MASMPMSGHHAKRCIGFILFNPPSHTVVKIRQMAPYADEQTEVQRDSLTLSGSRSLRSGEGQPKGTGRTLFYKQQGIDEGQLVTDFHYKPATR